MRERYLTTKLCSRKRLKKSEGFCMWDDEGVRDAASFQYEKKYEKNRSRPGFWRK